MLIPRRLPRLALGALVVIASLASSIRLNFFHYADPKQPYVYVQTFEDIYRLTTPLGEITARDPGAFQMTGHIVLKSYHPLPWVLGEFPNVGYYSDALPDRADADFLVIDESRVGELEAKLRDSYFTETFRLREAQEPARIYFRASAFAEVFPDRAQEFVPPAP